MPQVAVLVAHWPHDKADCELYEMLLAEKVEIIRANEDSAVIVLTGDRESFVSSEVCRRHAAHCEETIYLGLAHPAPEFLESVFLLLARARKDVEIRRYDIEDGAPTGIPLDAFEHAPAKLIDGLFVHADAAVKGGSASGLSGALGAFPRVLDSTALVWIGVALERGAAQMRSFVDLERRVWCLEDAVTSGVIRARAILSAMKASTVFDLSRHYETFCELGSAEIREMATARVNYLKIGEAAAKGAHGRNVDVNLLTLFAWWAAYFRGRAFFFEGRGDFASAVGALVREIEIVMLGELLDAGQAELTYRGECILNGREVTGVSPLLAVMREDIISGAGEEVWLALGATVGCRNHSSVGHGVSGLSRQVFSDGLDCLSKTWSSLARNGNQCSGVLKDLLANLQARVKFLPSEVLSRQVLVHAASISVERSA